MARGDGELQALLFRALKLPIPPRLSGRGLNFTVAEDEFRVATVGRVASCALAGPPAAAGAPEIQKTA